MQLKPYQEVVGTLTNVVNTDEGTTAIFSMIQEVNLPLDMRDLKDLEKFVGKRIGIINSDGKYLIRLIKRK